MLIFTKAADEKQIAIDPLAVIMIEKAVTQKFVGNDPELQAVDVTAIFLDHHIIQVAEPFEIVFEAITIAKEAALGEDQ